MSLEGTLETIALPDVLALLSVTAKTGELRVESGGGVGSIWFDTGRLAGFDVSAHRTPVDAMFALLRLREGNFKFHTGTEPVNPMPPQDVAPVLEEAESRLSKWPAISAAVPSLSCELKLRDRVEGPVSLTPEQWELVATIGGGRSVGEVLALRGLGEFDGCCAVKGLVDLRLVGVSEWNGPAQQASDLALRQRPADLAEAAPAPAHTASLAPRVPEGAWEEDDQVAPPEAEVADLSQVWDEATAAGQGEAAGEADAEPTAEPVNRGLLLKFLGSARN